MIAVALVIRQVCTRSSKRDHLRREAALRLPGRDRVRPCDGDHFLTRPSFASLPVGLVTFSLRSA